MIYRKIKQDEQKEFANLSSTAFHGNAEDAYKEIEKNDFQADDIRIIENEDGKIIAGLRLIEMGMRLDYEYVKCGGIGDVSSYPEYRRGGNISKLFDEVLKEMYDDDYVISYLYPFSHPFYRRYGYELCRQKNIVSFETAGIEYAKDDCYFKQHVPDTKDDLSDDIKCIYYKHAEHMNFMVDRKGWMWDRILKQNPFGGEARVYVCYRADGTSIAYFLYEHEKLDFPFLKAKIFDMAFVDRDAFEVMLRFIYRLAPAVKEITFACPAKIDALDIFMEAWKVKCRFEAGGMMRIINVQKALENMKRPDDTSIAVKVADNDIAENNGTFIIGECKVLRDDTVKPDMKCSIQILSQLVCGYKTIDEVLHKEGINVFSKKNVLDRVFTKKLIHTQDHF